MQGFPLKFSWSVFTRENEQDEKWARRMADISETAGAHGNITDVDITVGVAQLDDRYVDFIWNDSALSAKQLKALVTKLAGDPKNASALAAYAKKMLDSVDVNELAQKLPEVTALSQGVSTSAPASAALLQAVGADGLLNHVAMVSDFIILRYRGEPSWVLFLDGGY